MDLNAFPETEEDEVFPEPHTEEDNGQEEHIYNEHAEHGESAVQISRREREERIQWLKDNEMMTSHYMYPSFLHVMMGWLDCPAFGQELNCIIPSKVPLGESFNDYILPGIRYSFRQVIHQQRVLGRKLGLVIDLTNSSRYYVIKDCRKEGIKHVKIPCKRRDSVPDNEAVSMIVSQFLSRQKQSKKYILVHCTHGHNRTGYMIVHYLMRTQPKSVTQFSILAIKLFADARPLGIYKPDYIDALYNFYHENKPEMVVCPPTPEWKRSSEFDLNGKVVPDDDDEGFAAPPQESHKTQFVMTNDDILGDIIPVDQQETLRQFCYQSLKLPGVVRGNPQFPGSHPVSLNRSCSTSPSGLAEKVHHFTLLDGEMILDTLPDSLKKERRHLIYDMMAINQVSIVECPFNERWKMLEKELIEPRNTERQNMYQTRNPCYRYDMEPFRVRRKDFWMLSTVTKLLRGFIPKLSHAADGLIFQGWDDPYVPRTHEGLLKWKYPEKDSVDFLFELSTKYEQDCVRILIGQKLRSSHCNFPLLQASYARSTAYLDGRRMGVKVRLDKGTPNDFNTYRKVMRSINDNITEEILVRAKPTNTIILRAAGDILINKLQGNVIQKDHLEHCQFTSS
ncbi:mRNA-capping enzyme-like [Olea europaea subsp. europaea]|uniref:mRNA guanylyltransferase n=1 Tax=Olea europaea subsp. europaea TaxID=158383 RepID=A0A8S0PIA7_OLEEU|nr:mRNA-capping enzyme-like [Olea europaea subsp. europaea]